MTLANTAPELLDSVFWSRFAPQLPTLHESVQLNLTSVFAAVSAVKEPGVLEVSRDHYKLLVDTGKRLVGVDGIWKPACYARLALWYTKKADDDHRRMWTQISRLLVRAKSHYPSNAGLSLPSTPRSPASSSPAPLSLPQGNASSPFSSPRAMSIKLQPWMMSSTSPFASDGYSPREQFRRKTDTYIPSNLSGTSSPR